MLITTALLVLIISGATGLIWGGPKKAEAIVTWELKQLTKFGRWVLKRMFQTLADFFGYLAKSCAGSSKKKP
jgi:hypothetical protein